MENSNGNNGNGKIKVKRTALPFKQRLMVLDELRVHEAQYKAQNMTRFSLADVLTEKLGFKVLPTHVKNLASEFNLDVIGIKRTRLDYGDGKGMTKDRTRIVAEAVAQLYRELGIALPERFALIFGEGIMAKVVKAKEEKSEV